MIARILIGIGALTAAMLLAVVFGALRWRADTHRLQRRLTAARAPLGAGVVNDHDLDGLPRPVQRYLRVAIRAGLPRVATVRIRHEGTFNLGERGPQWKPFTSDQRVITTPPGFDWDARIAAFPGVAVRVHDAYVAGEGVLHASLFGLVSLADTRGGGALAQGELMRFLAEAVWYPTVLVPGQGVQWEPVDDRSARATLTDGAVHATLLFTFDDHDVVESVRAGARGRMVAGTAVSTPWRGRFRNYEERDGMRIPLEGAVEWLLPDGPRPYWRGRIAGVSYEFVPASRTRR